RSHVRQYGLNAVESAGQVDGDDALPVLGTHLADHSPHRRAGAVDEDVDAAPSLVYALGQSSEGVAIYDIERIGRSMAVLAGNLGRHRLGRRCVAVENRDLRPCRGKGPAGGGANPAPAAGNQGDLSSEILGHV